MHCPGIDFFAFSRNSELLSCDSLASDDDLMPVHRSVLIKVTKLRPIKWPRAYVEASWYLPSSQNAYYHRVALNVAKMLTFITSLKPLRSGQKKHFGSSRGGRWCLPKM